MESSKFKRILDAVDAGVMVVGQDGDIDVMNKMARTIIGINHESELEHSAGKIEEGDVVLFASNMLGNDDGNLEASDLKSLGIHDSSIEKDCSIVGIAVYGKSKCNPTYKVLRNKIATGLLNVDKTFKDKMLASTIDFDRRRITLSIDDMSFSMTYLISIGNIVVLDSKDLSVKFFQTKGYSYRRESIGELLRGEPFHAKEKNLGGVDPIGKNISHFFGDGNFVEDIYSLLNKREEDLIFEKPYFIKARQLLCSLKGMTINHRRYVIVNLVDVSELGGVLKSRNEIIEQMEKRIQSILPEYSEDLGEIKNVQGNSPLMQEVKYLIKRASKINTNVFITGESGTGKTLIAREIHRIQHPHEPFVEVNCSSIPQSLFESELFGYTPGSFTDALKKGKEGLFQKAGKGTIFLDEITEIPIELQGKLLHVIQDRRFYPIGATEPVEMKARIIAASNRDIREEVRLKNFREDLYYRINVFPIRVAPLRDRMEDVYFLVHNILEHMKKRYSIDFMSLSNAAFERMLEHSWPGNVRELENVIERAVLVAEGPIIFPEHLDIYEEHRDLSLAAVRDDAEKKAIQKALLLTKDKKELLDILKISKSSLYEKMKAYDLDFNL